MLRIRLNRVGRKNRPFYRLVLIDKKVASSGPYLEGLGHYDPLTKDLKLDKERVLFWLNKGARPSNTAAKLLTKANLKHKLIVVKRFRTKTKEEILKEKEEAEKERRALEAEKEKAKEAWEQKSQEEKKESTEPSSNEGRTASSEDNVDIKEQRA